jgi:hypothetical protein
MPGILPPFETNTVQQVQSISMILPDTGEVFDHALVRPLVARYANTPVSLARIVTHPRVAGMPGNNYP